MESYVVLGVRNIAILRASQLGDFIIALPAVQAKKNAYPAAAADLFPVKSPYGILTQFRL